MGMSFKSKPTAAALLALSGFGATQVFADGKFIVQPSWQKPAAVTVVEPQPARQFEWTIQRIPAANSQPTANNPSSDEDTDGGASSHITNSQPITNNPSSQEDTDGGALGHITNRQPTTTNHLSLEPADTLELSASDMVPSISASQSAMAASSGGLKWIARGSHAAAKAARHSAGPLELDNPNFLSPAPVASESQALAQSVAAQNVPLPTVPLNSSSSSTVRLFSVASEPWRAQDEPESPRAALASLVSSQIILGRPANNDSGRSVESIDNPPGWQAIGEELSGRLENCEALINRKAYFSAREDAEAAMLYLMRVLDLMSNSYRSEPTWYAASKAMSEAEDFSTAQRLTSDSDFLRRVILSHETPVLKDVDAATLAPLAAAQHYRQYAEEKLIEAAQGHPWASEVAYALGRSYQAQADLAEVGSQQNLRWRAITLYRGARGIAPTNALATNQLGFVLLQMDRPADAREALVASINACPSLTAYENLVEASRRAGDAGTANWAMQQAQSFRYTLPVASDAPAFVELDPRTFAALSPYTVGPNPQPQNAPTQPYRAAAFTFPTNN